MPPFSIGCPCLSQSLHCYGIWAGSEGQSKHVALWLNWMSPNGNEFVRRLQQLTCSFRKDIILSLSLCTNTMFSLWSSLPSMNICTGQALIPAAQFLLDEFVCWVTFLDMKGQNEPHFMLRRQVKTHWNEDQFDFHMQHIADFCASSDTKTWHKHFRSIKNKFWRCFPCSTKVASLASSCWYIKVLDLGCIDEIARVQFCLLFTHLEEEYLVRCGSFSRFTKSSWNHSRISSCNRLLKRRVGSRHQ